MRRWFVNLPDADLAYLPEGTEHFDDYVAAVEWAQEYARVNRELMMASVVEAVRATGLLPAFAADLAVVNCHHNYVAREHHYGANVFVTRKGAVRARDVAGRGAAALHGRGPPGGDGRDRVPQGRRRPTSRSTTSWRRSATSSRSSIRSARSSA